MLGKLICRFLPDRLLLRFSPLFDEKYYRAQLPKGADCPDAIAHYLTTGWKQGFDPSAAFGTERYLAANADVRSLGLNPLAHYLRHGRWEGRPGAGKDANDYRACSTRRALKRGLAKLVCGGLMRKNANARILVVAHMFYLSAVPEVIEYLKNLQGYRYDLVVTCTEGFDPDAIGEAVKAFRPDARIVVCPNRGFDIAPFLEVLQGIDLDAYDVVFKLQTKGTPHRATLSYGQYVKDRDWFLFLFEGALGAFRVHRNIDRLLHDPTAGLIAPANLLVQDPRHKAHLTQKQLARLGLSLPEGYTYVAGTCYVEKAAALKPLKALGLGLKDFGATERSYFSPAHAMERWMTAALPDGMKLVGVNVCPLRRKLRAGMTQKKLAVNGLRLLEDDRFDLPDGLALRTLEHRDIARWELVEVPLASLAVRRAAGSETLKDCPVYKACGGDMDGYAECCSELLRGEYAYLSREDFEAENARTCEALLKVTLSDIEKNGYDARRPIVTLWDGKRDRIEAGWHTAACLLYLNGETAAAKVLRLYPC